MATIVWTMNASGKTAGRVDSPSGKRHRSMKQVPEKVWYRDPNTKRLVRVKTVEKIDVGTQIEEIFNTQSISPQRWSILKSLVSAFSWA